MHTNDDVYAAGLLNRALDPANQPEAIRRFMAEEIQLIHALVPAGARLLDVGCGTGRHLLDWPGPLPLGVGVDYERSYLRAARARPGPASIVFLVADAARIPFASGSFDAAVCLTNTWGTMSDKAAVLEGMRRCAPERRTRYLTVFAPDSVDARRDWYDRLGHRVTDVTPTHIETEGGFRSEHFSRERLESLVGDAEIHVVADIAFLARF